MSEQAAVAGQIPPPLAPPHKGEGDLARGSSPSPLWGGIKGGGTGLSRRAHSSTEARP